MKKYLQSVLFISFILGNISAVGANKDAPWGSAGVLDIKYGPGKVLYDLTSGNKEDISNILDRVSYLFKLYESDIFDSSIVVIIHGDAIPFFAIEGMKKHSEIMKRAQSLTVGTSIEFRMCRAAAKVLKYEPEDIHGFVKMVPMADAEIVRLQKNNYTYMQ